MKKTINNIGRRKAYWISTLFSGVFHSSLRLRDYILTLTAVNVQYRVFCIGDVGLFLKSEVLNISATSTYSKLAFCLLKLNNKNPVLTTVSVNFPWCLMDHRRIIVVAALFHWSINGQHYGFR